MGDITPRPIPEHNLVTTKYHCQRCAHVVTVIPKNWTHDCTQICIPISAESLQPDCALCVQLRRVFELICGPFTHCHQQAHVKLEYLFDSLSRTKGMPIGIQFIPVGMSNEISSLVEMYPVQSTEFARPQVVRRIIYHDEPDYQFIRTQLDTCYRSHGQACMRATVGTHVLRVIDCKSRRLVTAKPDEPYACLSYVWGSGTAKDTQSFGDELPAEMPKTIEDAMAVAIALDVPFLWVDRYCIDQENLQEKHNTIQNMNRIYEGAEITIIAACGDDPHHGLPGVRGTPRKPQIFLPLADTTFLVFDDIYGEINTTKWAQRGWTYQEMLLSRRRLVFTNTQMYFQCRTAHCMESLHPSFTASSLALRSCFRAFPSNGIGDMVSDLRLRLAEYYDRQLSFDTDVINAFEGIVSAFDQSESFPFRLTHFYGVLLVYKHDDENSARKSFISSLSWQAGKVRIDGKVFYEKLGTGFFPSWSWASTKVKSIQGHFTTLDLSFGKPPLFRCEQVQINFTHKIDEDMDICEFLKHSDSYEMFHPLIKLTTWVAPCPLAWTYTGVPLLFGLEWWTEFQPEASCNTLHLAYLGAVDFWVEGVCAFALILEEVEPGVFCRIGRWWTPIDLNTSKSTHEILDMAISKAWRSTRKNLYKTLQKAWGSTPKNLHSTVVDFDKEAVSPPQWEMKTVTIV